MADPEEGFPMDTDSKAACSESNSTIKMEWSQHFSEISYICLWEGVSHGQLLSWGEGEELVKCNGACCTADSACSLYLEMPIAVTPKMLGC